MSFNAEKLLKILKFLKLLNSLYNSGSSKITKNSPKNGSLTHDFLKEKNMCAPNLEKKSKKCNTGENDCLGKNQKNKMIVKKLL